jgi:hypothetical protein
MPLLPIVHSSKLRGAVKSVGKRFEGKMMEDTIEDTRHKFNHFPTMVTIYEEERIVL